MADKEIKVKVTTEADISNLEDLSNVIGSAKESADELSESLDELSDADLAYLMGEIDDMPEGFYESIEAVDELNDSLGDIDGGGLGDANNSADDLSDSLDTATSSSDDLSSSLGGIDNSSLSDAAGSADELSESLDNATTSSEGLSDSMGLVDATMLLSSAQQIGQYGAQAEGLAQDMNTAAISVGQLATQAGIAESQMIGLVNNISNATFPQDEAMQYIQLLDQLGVSADKLGTSATNMDRINDAFHIGSTGVATLTGNLYAMGVPADNLESSFNALGYAQSNVAGGVDKFNTVLQRLGPAFSEYGFNVDQAAIITAGATHQWGTGRKAMTNLSNALKEANGDTRALEQALGLEAGALDNASQITGQYAGQVEDLAKEEAEHKTWLDQLGAAWEDISLTMSPVLEPLSSFMGLIGQAGSYAVGINGLIQLTQTLREAEAAQWLLNIAMDANPIMILVIAIGILIAALVYLYYNNEQVRAAIDSLGQAFYNIGTIIYNYLVLAFNTIVSTLQGVWNYIITLGGLLPANVNLTGNKIMDTVLRVMAFIATLPIQLQIIFVNMVAKTLGFGDNFSQNMINAGANAVNSFISSISNLSNGLAGELNEMINEALNFAGRIGSILWDAGVNAVTNFLGGIDRHSPGKMQREFVAEITEMGDRVPYESRNLISNVSGLGDDIVGAFNPELSLNNIKNDNVNGLLNKTILNLNNQSNGTSGDIIVNVYGDIDSDRRIQTLVDAVKRELYFDNKTAGRTI